MIVTAGFAWKEARRIRALFGPHQKSLTAVFFRQGVFRFRLVEFLGGPPFLIDEPKQHNIHMGVSGYNKRKAFKRKLISDYMATLIFAGTPMLTHTIARAFRN
ncbi:hypothetical protein M422DRAFT_271841 [Sphaerobolus stellatus SS14]|uniref:Uncharacterized protein n=1 Tax=Sphaerobolus stellatus (strain SS14) TaxID=990650 RepID=A0A0C9UNH1_SPHS4|nr:hypothetical protein M422DRAFT_271841 [Sphaerobolus stellatus SS14]